MPAKSRIVGVYNLAYTITTSQWVDCSSADSAVVMIERPATTPVFLQAGVDKPGGSTYHISETPVLPNGTLVLTLSVLPQLLRVVLGAAAGTNDYIILRRSIG